MNATTEDQALALLEADGVIAPQDLGRVLDDVVRFIKRFVVFQSPAQGDAIALWVVHTHVIDAAEATPYLAVTSPEKQSGKTRLQEVLELLVARPLRTSNTSSAALFRELDKSCPTLLFDEADATFGRKGDTTEELRGMLNDGYRRGGTVLRIVGDKQLEAKRFRVFGPKLIAAIGNLPDTVADRSIEIRLHRRAAGERCDRFRRKRVEPQAEPLRVLMEAWAEEHTDELRNADPALPDELSDRQQDVWEPLLAIADAAGGRWAERARTAAVELTQGRDTEESLGVLLLTHMRDLFDAAGTDRLPTDEVLRRLVERDDGPWGDWWGKDVEAGQTKGPGVRLARKLRDFSIKPGVIRVGDHTHRGYLRDDFEAAWQRYTPTPPTRRNDVTPQVEGGFPASDPESKSGSDLGCYDVTSLQGGNGVTGSTDVAESVTPPGHTAPCQDGDQQTDSTTQRVLETFPGSEVVTDSATLQRVELARQDQQLREWNEAVRRQHP